MPAPVCVLLDIRGHSEELFDESYMVFLERAFRYYGEDAVFLHTDATPFCALAPALAPGAPRPPSYSALLQAHLAAAPALPHRERCPKAQANFFKSAAMWLRWGSFDAEAVLGPLLRTLFSARCQGAHVPSAAALRASLRAFLLESVAPRVPPGAPLHVYWASHGNFLCAPALASRRGVYGVVALRSEAEKAEMADTSLPAEWLAEALLAPLARALAPRGSALLWSHHSCWAAPIMAAAARALHCALAPGQRACLLADKPSTAPFKADYLRVYNDNLAFVLPWCEGTKEGLQEAAAALLACLPAHEVGGAATRVRWELERELKSRAAGAPPGAGAPPLPPQCACGRDAHRPRLTVPELRALWPVASAPGTPKKAWEEWEFALLHGAAHGGGGAISDARFAGAYAAAAAAGAQALEEALGVQGGGGGAEPALNEALAHALCAAAAALRAAVPPGALAGAEGALAEGARSGFPEAAMEDFYLRGRECRGSQGGRSEGSSSEGSSSASSSSSGEEEEEGLSGGREAWAAVAGFAGSDRPCFLAYLRSVARASAELSAAQAPLRLEALARVLRAMAPMCDAGAMMGVLRSLFFNAPLNNVGDQSSGGHFGSLVLLEWLAGGAASGAPRTPRALERHMYSQWAQWAVGAAGGGAQLGGGVYQAEALRALTAFPEDLAGRTGIVHQWGLEEGFDLATGESGSGGSGGDT